MNRGTSVVVARSWLFRWWRSPQIPHWFDADERRAGCCACPIDDL